MKKLFLLAMVVTLFSFTTGTEDKEIVLKFKSETLVMYYNGLTEVQKLVNKSSMPHDQVTFILETVDSLKRDMSKQFNAKK